MTLERLLPGALFACVAFLASSPVVLDAQELKNSVPSLTKGVRESAAPYTLEDANTWIKEVLPLVEQVAGRKFKALPTVKLIDRWAFAELLVRELIPRWEKRYPGFDKTAIQSQAKELAAREAPGFLGKYEIQEKALFLLPFNILPVLRASNVDVNHVRPILKLIVAHELLHALQDQEVHLFDPYSEIQSADGALAMNALIEGQAYFVQFEVGRILGLDDAVQDLHRIHSASAFTSNDQFKQMGNLTQITKKVLVDLGGEKFVAYHCARGGMERIWNFFDFPPTDTYTIAHPETYSKERPKKRDYRRILEGLEKDFGERPWVSEIKDIGYFQMRASYANFEPDQREKLLENVESNQSLEIREPLSTKCVAVVNLVVLKDAALIKTAIGMVEEHAATTAARGRAPRPVFEDFEAIQADVARRVSFEAYREGKRTKSQSVWIGRGRYLIQYIDEEIFLDKTQIAKIAQKIFERLEDTIPER
jgi:hypothetical protein